MCHQSQLAAGAISFKRGWVWGEQLNLSIFEHFSTCTTYNKSAEQAIHLLSESLVDVVVVVVCVLIVIMQVWMM